MSTFSVEEVYTRSTHQAVALFGCEGGRVALAVRPTSSPLFGGFPYPALADMEGEVHAAATRIWPQLQGKTLVTAGAWDTPPFTPHRRHVTALLAEVADDTPGLVFPAEVLEQWRQGQVYLDTPTRLVLEALADVDSTSLEKKAAAIQARLDAADPHPRGGLLASLPLQLSPGLAVLPLRTPTLPPATHTNCYLLGENEILIVDPASPHPAEQARLDELITSLGAQGRQVVGIFLTHHHIDHVGGAEHLRRKHLLPIYAHPITAERVADHLDVDETLVEGDTLPLAGQDLTCLFTPGHAPGHLCLYSPRQKFLVAGDMVAGWGSIVVEPGDGDMASYLHQLERLAALEPRLTLPAHGPPQVPGAGVLMSHHHHRKVREGQIITLLRQRAHSPAELVAHMYQDVPQFLHPLAERAVLAHLIMLQREERALERAGIWYWQ